MVDNQQHEPWMQNNEGFYTNQCQPSNGGNSNDYNQWNQNDAQWANQHGPWNNQGGGMYSMAQQTITMQSGLHVFHCMSCVPLPLLLLLLCQDEQSEKLQKCPNPQDGPWP